MENKSQTPNTPVKKKNVKRPIFFLWLSSFLLLASIVGVFILAYFGIIGDDLPNARDLENPDIYVASEIISQDGKVIDQFELEKRIPLEYKDLPIELVNGVIAKEDVRFFEHNGIDWKRTASAITSLGSKGGGSTITQQLAKLLFSKKPENKIERITQKVQEYILAVQLERLYTKEEIIAMYFNKFDFLNKAYGIQMAAKVYYNKDAKDLTPDEGAVFVAMLQMPWKYNPKSNAAKAMLGKEGVLNKMAEHGYLSVEDARKYKAKPIVIDFQPLKEGNSEYSAYYKHYLKSEIEKYLKDYEKESGKKYSIYKDGLKIYVTLDSKMQSYAEEAMQEHLKSVQRRFNAEQRYNKRAPFRGVSDKGFERIMVSAMKRTQRYKTMEKEGLSLEKIIEEFKKPIRLDIFTWSGTKDTLMSPWDSIRHHKHIVRGSLMSMEPYSGNIKAWVGGVNWEHFKYDLVKQGKRQVGSTFKPIVYAASMKELGYTPCTTISNATYNKGGWKVSGSGGSLSIRQALAASKNPVAARLIEDVGVDNVIQLARNMGVTSPIQRNNTIALGSGEVSLFEMVGVYGTLANYGTYMKPQMIWRIEDSKGKVVKENIPEFYEVMHEMYAYQMIDIMMGVTQGGGTAKRVRGMGITGQVAGKTGTTNDNSDAWFMGIVPKLVTGVWVGWEDRNARLNSAGEGASSALPIWAGFMRKVYADESLKISQKDKFVIPNEETYTECGYPDVSEDAESSPPTLEQLYSSAVQKSQEAQNSYNSSRNRKDTVKKQDVNDNLSKVDTLQDVM